jgi:thiaminase/transcriptional activator TenA
MSDLISMAGALWQEATRSPFLDAVAAGTLPAEAFRRWLGQDYLFAKGLTAFQAIVVSKVPRECHQPLIAGLAALDAEMDWFETHAARLGLHLDVPPLPACRRYIDFLMRAAYTFPYPVLLAILYGVEVSYLEAWSALPAAGPYREFIERWSNPAFRRYVADLESLATRHPHPQAQQNFNCVLEHERDFWKMSWEG